MYKIFHFDRVNIIFFSLTILMVSLFNTAHAELTNEEKFTLLTECVSEKSALSRLACYDNVLRPTATILTNQSGQHSPIWHWIVDQEKERAEDHTSLIFNTYDEGDRVLLTVPAIGEQPPRPILAISCIDNITRMQIVLFRPMDTKNNQLQLVTDRETINASWFVRDDGFLFETSRGLLGIEQIKRMLNTKSLTLKSDDPVLNGLVFNLTELDTIIKPLRTACHW